MANDLLDMVTNYLNEEAKLSRMKEDLISSLEKEIIQVEYELQEITVAKAGSSNDKDFQIYYPVLQCSESFTKEDEIFYKAEHTDAVFHKYILKGESGRILEVMERASLYRELAQEDNGLLACINYITGHVDYDITIEDGHKYSYHRKFDEDAVNQGKNELFMLKDNFFDNENDANERSFRRFLGLIGSTSSITLKEIMNSSDPEKEIQLTQTISAKCQIKKNKKKGEVWLKNSKLGVRINNWKMCQMTIVIQAYFAINVKLENQTFRMWQIEDEDRFRNGVKFEEAMELIKSQKSKESND